MDLQHLKELMAKYGIEQAASWALTAMGLGLPITIFATAAFFLSGWIGGVKTAVKVTQLAGQAASSLRQVPKRGSARAIVVTILVPLAQLLTLGLCYLGGNFVAIVLDKHRQLLLEQAVRRNPALVVDPEDVFKMLTLTWLVPAYKVFGGLLQFDTIPQIYVSLAALLIVLSYFWARRHDDRLEWAGILVGLPGGIVLGLSMLMGILYLILLAFAVAVGLLGLVVEGDGQSFGSFMLDIVSYGLPILFALIPAYIYYWVCKTAVRASRIVALAWSSDTT